MNEGVEMLIGRGLCPICGRSVKPEEIEYGIKGFTSKCPCGTLLVVPNTSSIMFVGSWRHDGTEKSHVEIKNSVNEKDREEAIREAAEYFRWGPRYKDTLVVMLERVMTKVRSEVSADYEEVLGDYRRLTKDLDDAMNGNDAAEAPSLCDIVAQVRKIGPLDRISSEAVKAERDGLSKNLMSLKRNAENDSPEYDYGYDSAIDAVIALLTAEPEPCEDAQWWTCPDCGARYPLTPTEKLGDEEYDGPTQYFVSQGGLRTPRVYGSRPVICACKASQVAAKQTEDLRAENERLLEALTIISKRDDWTGGECRHHAHDAIMGAWPISTHPDNGDNKPNA